RSDTGTGTRTRAGPPFEPVYGTSTGTADTAASSAERQGPQPGWERGKDHRGGDAAAEIPDVRGCPRARRQVLDVSGSGERSWSNGLNPPPAGPRVHRRGHRRRPRKRTVARPP